MDVRNSAKLFCVFKWQRITWAQKHIASTSWAWVKTPISAGFLHEWGQVVEHMGQYFPHLAACGLHLLTKPQNGKYTELFIYDFDQRLP